MKQPAPLIGSVDGEVPVNAGELSVLTLEALAPSHSMPFAKFGGALKVSKRLASLKFGQEGN